MLLDTTKPFSGFQSLSPPISQLSPELNKAFLSPSPQTVNLTNSSIKLAAMKPHAQIYGYLNSRNKLLFTTPSAHPQQKHSTFDENRNQQNPPNQIADGALPRKQQKNEISKSLITLAMLASSEGGNDTIKPASDSPVDDIMRDFYCNGYVTDDSNIYRQGNSSMETASILSHNYCAINTSNNSNYGTHTRGNVTNTFNNYSDTAFLSPNYINQNYWLKQLNTPSAFLSSDVTSQITQQHATYPSASAAATAAASANIDFNTQHIKKPSKRYGNIKFDKVSAVKHCVFCENNNEPEAVVKSHAVRDSLGRVLCPKLRTYICPICNASGDKAHTVKYCPQKPIITMEDAVKAESLRLAKNYYKQGMIV